MSIAYDAASAWTTGSSVTSITFALTVGVGSNRMLFVTALSTNNDVTATYAGVSMTKILTQVGADSRTLSMFALPAPTSGVNDIIITAEVSAAVLQGGGASYSGVAQTTTMDSTTTSTIGTDVTTYTGTLTTVANNCWTVMGLRYVGGNAGYTAGVNTTIRNASANTGLSDSNSVKTPAGSTSQTITVSNGTGGAYLVMASFAPVAAPTGVNTSRKNYISNMVSI